MTQNSFLCEKAHFLVKYYSSKNIKFMIFEHIERGSSDPKSEQIHLVGGFDEKITDVPCLHASLKIEVWKGIVGEIRMTEDTKKK